RRAWRRRRARRTGAGSSTTGAGEARRGPHGGASGADAAAGRVRRSLRGQSQLEGRALADLGLELDRAPERVRELVCDRQPEPRSAALVLGPEGPEDPLAILVGNARAGVANGHRHAPVLLAEVEVDAAAVRRPAKGVREQVRDDLQHAVA